MQHFKTKYRFIKSTCCAQLIKDGFGDFSDAKVVVASQKFIFVVFIFFFVVYQGFKFERKINSIEIPWQNSIMGGIHLYVVVG